MKNIRKRIISFFTTGILLFSLLVSAFAAETSASSFGFILPDDVRVPSEQSFRADDTGIKGMRKFLNGTIGAYITDLDSDGKREMIDVYLRSPESGDTTQIRIGLYEKDATENTILRQEFLLSEFYASQMRNFSFKLSYFESNAGKFLICNEIMIAGAGILSTAHILSIGKDKKLYAATSLLDPGATSGICLCRFDNTPASHLSQIKSAEGTILYSWNMGDSGEPSSQAYYNALNRALAPYGTSAAVSPICGGYLADTPFIVQGETDVIAELSVDLNYHTKGFYSKYSGSNPFNDHRMPETKPFDPEKFYHKILNKLRPKEADSFCLMDMDNDGREELLLSGENRIMAVYSSHEYSDQPVQLFIQSPTWIVYSLSSNGIVSYNPNPNMHGQVYGRALYRIGDGRLNPIHGSFSDLDTCKYYQTENKELLMLPLSYDFSEWNVISEDEFHQALSRDSFEPLNANMTAFTEYDRQHEFNPEIFYQKILNQQRPSYTVDSRGYAAGYRFLDLDADGKEELLLCGGSLNHAWAPIRAVYTSKPGSDEPVLLDIRYNPYDGGELGCRISYTDGIGGTVLYSSMADLLPMSIQVLYRLSAGALIPICGFAEKTGSDRVFYTENADYLAEPGKYDYIEWDVGTQSDSKVSEMKALIEKTYDIKPYLCSCVNYDAQQEYQKNHPETIIPVSGASGYDALLRKIRGIAAAPHRIESEGFGTSSLSTDNFSHLWLEYYLQGMLTNPCFVLRDLNSDGTPELAVGNRLEDGNFELFDLYTIYDGEIVHLASSVNRDRFSIGVNNEIVEVDFPSAQYNTKIAYELKNGKLEPKRALQVDYMTYYSLDNGGTSAESWREITQSDYIEKSDTEYPVLQNPEMIDLLTWNEGSAVSGDFNGDDTVSVADAVLLARFVAEDETLSDEQIDLILKAQPDQDSDGIVTISDVLYTLKYCCN